MGPGEVAAELVDVHGLVVFVGLGKPEVLAGDEGGDAVVGPQLHAGAVHPAFVLVHQGQGLPGVVQQLVDDGVLEDQVRLKQQGVVLAQIVLGQGQGIDVVGLVVNGVLDIDNGRPDAQGVDIFHELLALVAHHDDDAGQMAAFDLMEHPVDQGHPVDLHHALGPVLGQLLQPLAHARRQYDCLHMDLPFFYRDLTFHYTPCGPDAQWVRRKNALCFHFSRLCPGNFPLTTGTGRAILRDNKRR